MKKLLCALLLGATPMVFPMINESKSSSIEWGLSDRQGRRKTMEDAHVFELISVGAEKVHACFGLFDGHGGVRPAHDAAQYIATSLSQDIKNALQTTTDLDEAIKTGLRTACSQIDQLIKTRYENEGTTALIVMLVGRLAYLAWVGDSRALIISKDGTIKGFTGDHKPDSPCEVARVGIEKIMVQHLVNGNREQFVLNLPLGNPLQLGRGQKVVKRVARIGALSVSRSLGDKKSKENQPVIIADPDIQVAEVSEGDYLILACDGLWDVMTNERVAEFVSERLSWTTEQLQECYRELMPCMSEPNVKEIGSSEQLRLIARAVRNKAYDLKSDDNISVMIIKI